MGRRRAAPYQEVPERAGPATVSSMQPMDRVELTGQTLTCAQVRAVARRRAQARVSADAWARVRRSADLIARIVATQPVYGRTTGVGANRTVAIAVDPRGRAEHGSALLRSHAGGAGPLLDADRARAMLVVRLNQLAAGGSGVSPPLLQALVEALDRGLVPAIHVHGAIGTGDLTALACTALCLNGEREWRDVGIVRLVEFDASDALAFLSSNAATISGAALACADLSDLLAAALVVAALSLMAVGGSTQPYAAAVQQAHAHPGQLAVAATLRALLDGCAGPARRLQDPFGYRVLPQVHGAAVDATRVHLAGHRLAVEAPAFAHEEVAGVDDLANLAERLRVRLADLGGHQPGQGFGVGFHDPPRVADGPAAHRRRYAGPAPLGGPGGPAGRDERARIAEGDLRDDLGGTRGVDRPVPAAAGQVGAGRVGAGQVGVMTAELRCDLDGEARSRRRRSAATSKSGGG